MRTISSLTLSALFLTVLLSLIGLTSANLVDERVYEETLFLAALQQDLEFVSADGRVWSDHPPLPYVIFSAVGHLIRLLSIDDVYHQRACFRLMSGMLYLATCLVAVAVLRELVPLRNRFWVMPIIVLPIVTIPELLVHGCRADGAVVADVSCFVFVWFTLRVLRTHAFVDSLGASVGGLGLTWSNIYGVAMTLAICFSVTLLQVLLIVGKRRTEKRTAQWQLATVELAIFPAIAVLVLATSTTQWFAFGARWNSLVGHYWATSLRPLNYRVPLSYFWPFVFPYLSRLPLWVSDFLQIVLVVYTGLVSVIAYMKCGNRKVLILLSAMGTLIVVTALLVWTNDRAFMVPHYLGCYLLFIAVLLATTTIEVFGPYRTSIVAFFIFSGANAPFLASRCLEPGRADKAHAAALSAIDEGNADVDHIVFAGTRTFIIFRPWLTKEQLSKSIVFIREGAHPDNFTGRTMIEPQRLVFADDLPMMKENRIIYVQLTAAQSISFDTFNWSAEDIGLFAHPSVAIGEIIVMRLVPR